MTTLTAVRRCGDRRHRYPQARRASLRDGGAQSGCIMAGPEASDEAGALGAVRARSAGLKGLDLAKSGDHVRHPYDWAEGTWRLGPAAVRSGALALPSRLPRWWHWTFGVKRNILRISWWILGCRVTVVAGPVHSAPRCIAHSARRYLSSPMARVIPEPCDYAIDLACAQASDARGAPVVWYLPRPPDTGACQRCQHGKDEVWAPRRESPGSESADGTVMVTSQNHGFTVSEERIYPTPLR